MRSRAFAAAFVISACAHAHRDSVVNGVAGVEADAATSRAIDAAARAERAAIEAERSVERLETAVEKLERAVDQLEIRFMEQLRK